MYEKNRLTIKIKKEDLLKAIKSNRDKHALEYRKAKAGFRKLLEEELNAKLKAVVEGKSVELTFKSVKPTSHLKEYDDIIGMLELSTDTEFEINHEQYRQYVKNEWEWERVWHASNALNLSAVVN